jgi:hypothetical protein
MTPNTLSENTDIFSGKPKNKESFESYLDEVSLESSWCFDFGATRHVKGNSGPYWISRKISQDNRHSQHRRRK